jgi:hypothetical protein
LASELSDGEDIDIQFNYIEALLANSRKNQAKMLLDKIKPETKEQRNKMVKFAGQF